MNEAFRPAPRAAWRDGAPATGERLIAEETPIALIYNTSTYAVMMASPVDLEDFAVGFSLTEGVITEVSQIAGFEAAADARGIEARIWLDPARAAGLAERRRHVAGPTGCGLCGVESLEAALRPAPTAPETGQRLTPAQILAAMAALSAQQPLNEATRATHAAGLVAPDGRLVAVREDVGRHNALDKLVGAVARGRGAEPGGAVVLTSRVSVEMVQKSAVLGAAFVIAISAPTSLAIETAGTAGITLIGVTRPDGFEVFTRADRVILRIVGLVLAGGRSRRFGADKALAELGGRSLLGAALDVLHGACDQVAVSARNGPIAEEAAARGLPALPDPPGAPDGPLAGVLAGLIWAEAAGADLLATAPCDTPFLPADLLAHLAGALAEDDGLAFARAPDGAHPLCGLWRTRLIAPLRQMLAEGRHPPVRAAVVQLGGRAVDFPDPTAFFNVNTRADLAEAAQALISRDNRPIADGHGDADRQD